jgi:hypothetical protein
MSKEKVSDRLASVEENDPFAEIDRRIEANYPDLTDDEKALIKEKAREHVLKVKQDRADDARQKLVEKATERAVRDAEKVAGLHGAFVDVTINLSPSAGGGSAGHARPAYIMLDGEMFFHGITYEVPANVAATIVDISARTWEHENEIRGQPRRADMSRRQTLVNLSPHGSVNTSAMPQV